MNSADVHSIDRTRPVLCLHASLSSSRQWQGLTDTLGPGHQVHAVDLHGHGRAPAWGADRPMRMDDELDRLESLMAGLSGPVSLVGHSYGGAVAAALALRHPGRIASLVLYEPVLFGLLEPGSPGAVEVAGLRRDVRLALAHRRPGRAARHFIDYWSGPGSFASLPGPRRAAMALGMRAVLDNFDAIEASPLPLALLGAVSLPVLLLTGSESPAPVREVSRRLAGLLPGAEHWDLPGVGHMAPVTHGALVDPLIAHFVTSGGALPVAA